MGKYLDPARYDEIMAGKPANVDSSDIDSELRARGYDVPAPVTVQTSRGMETVSPTARDTGGSFEREASRFGLNALPFMGGLVGGRAGVRGATLGGAAGEAAKQGLLQIPAISRVSGMQPASDPMDAAAKIAASSVLEGGAQGAGSLISGGIKRLPRSFMGSALKLPGKKVQQWRTMRQRARPEIAKEVPADMIDAALEENLVLGGSPAFPGTKQVEALRGQSAAEADAMLKTIKSGRSRVSPPLNASVLLDDVWKLKASLKSSPRAAEDMAMVDDLADKFLASHRKVGKGGGIKFEKLTPDEVNEIKTSAQRRIKDVYEKKGATLDGKKRDQQAIPRSPCQRRSQEAGTGIRQDCSDVGPPNWRPCGGECAHWENDAAWRTRLCS